RVDREMYSFERTVREPCKVAVREAKPDPSGRIGDELARGRHPPRRARVADGRSSGRPRRRRPLVANDQIVDPDELPAGTPGGDPDVTIDVFDDRSRHADGLTVALVDPAELAIVKNGERIVDADPETAGMIFEGSGHLAARQGAA